MNRRKKVMLSAAVLVAFSGTAWAEEEYALNPVLVTAAREEMTDLDTPASTEVISREDLEKSGAGNAYEALSHSLGLSSSAQLPGGAAMGSMTSKISIRGVSGGTLVLVDGVPVNQDGKYNLEDIAADTIDHIEVVRGGGSVLYGSEASGGVINIITRKNAGTSLKVSAGNFGRERYSVNTGADRFSVSAYLENRGDSGRFTTDKWIGKTKSWQHINYAKGEDKGITWKYDLAEGLTFTHNFSKNKNIVDSLDTAYADKYQRRRYDDENNSFLLNYDDKKGFTAFASYGTQERQYDQTNFERDGSIKNAFRYSWRKGHNTHVNVQKKFDLAGENSFLLGTSFQREDMDLYSGSGDGSRSNYARDIYAFYASYDWSVTEKDRLIFSGRETLVRHAEGHTRNLGSGETARSEQSEQKDQSKFTPEVQYIRRLTDDSSFYAKAGQSFRLPYLSQIFGGAAMLPNINLQPEHGTHYEMGYKLNDGKTSWRVALFHYDLKDSIQKVSGDPTTGDVRYDNLDSKNTGIEISADIAHNDVLSTSWGLTWSIPEEKKTDADGTSIGWVRHDNAFQLTGAVDYHRDKWRAALSANYIGLRADDTTDGRTWMKPALFTDLDISYAPDDDQRVFLHINNLLDRKDYTTTVGPDRTTFGYLSEGINFMIGYEYKL